MGSADMDIRVDGNVSGGVSGLKQVQSELGKTAIAAQKTDSTIGKMGSSFTGISAKSQIASTALSSIGDAAGGAVTGVTSLGASLLTGGIILAIPLIVSGLSALGEAFFGLSAAEKAMADSQEAAVKGFTKAGETVAELTVELDLAAKGFIDKEEAVKHYNETIGKTTGLVTSVEEAEAALIKKGPAYIQFMFLKAQATYAFGKASEIAVQSLLIQSQKVGGNGIVGKAFDSFTNTLNKQSEAFKKIAADAETLAGIISKDNDFNFFGTNKEGKEVKPIKVKEVKIHPDKIKVYPPANKRDIELASGGANDIVIKIPVTFAEAEASKGQEGHNKELAGGIADKLIGGGVDDVTKELKKRMDLLNELAQNIISNGANEIIAGVAQGIGQALASGDNAIPNLFGKLMGGVGRQIEDLGKFFIKSGITIKTAKEVFKKLLANPIASVLVGIGLVALGAAIQSQANKKYSGQGFATGTRNFQGGTALVGERGPERIFLPQGSSVQPNNELSAYSGGGITLMPSIQYSGDGFRIMLNRVDKQFGRNN